MRQLSLGWVAVLATAVVGCGGSPSAPADDTTFYLHQRGVIDKRYSWERYFPPLDRDESARVPRRVGVSIFEGDVRMSRPVDWYLRTADYNSERRQISYQSPRQFVFNIYERTDPVGATWNEVLTRYEEDVEKAGSQILSKRIPVATSNAQGRSYFIKTRVAARPEPHETFAHEIIVRSGGRVLLVQIIHSENIESSVDEMTDVLRSMLVY